MQGGLLARNTEASVYTTAIIIWSARLYFSLVQTKTVAIFVLYDAVYSADATLQRTPLLNLNTYFAFFYHAYDYVNGCLLSYLINGLDDFACCVEH